MTSTNPSVLIVCLGNICRSPLGEAVLQHVAKQRGLNILVDSAGTSHFNIGKGPDQRTINVCKKYGISINNVARQVSSEDFDRFTYILAADENNLANLKKVQPDNSKADVRLFGSYDDNKPIADPYYDGDTGGFEKCYEQCLRYSNKFLDEVVGTASDSTTAPSHLSRCIHPPLSLARHCSGTLSAKLKPGLNWLLCIPGFSSFPFVQRSECRLELPCALDYPRHIFQLVAMQWQLECEGLRRSAPVTFRESLSHLAAGGIARQVLDM